VVITHGNGPQVGFIMRRSEIARKVEGLHIVPLVSCVADTQGALGWQIQQALDNALRRKGLENAMGKTVTIVTQVEVDPGDPAFKDPSKPVGEFYDDDQLPLLKQQHPDWQGEAVVIAEWGRKSLLIIPELALEFEQNLSDNPLPGSHVILSAPRVNLPYLEVFFRSKTIRS